MTEDDGNESNPQEEATPTKNEPILLNWLITIAGLGGISLVAVWLTQ